MPSALLSQPGLAFCSRERSAPKRSRTRAARLRYLSLAVHELERADVLSYRLPKFLDDPLGWITTKPIAVAGRGQEVHTALAEETPNGWIALGMRLAKQKLKFLADEVAQAPGLIDVYRYVGLSARQKQNIVEEMTSFALADRYGWWNVLRSGLYVLPVVRFLVPRELEGDRRRPYCSQAVAWLFEKHAQPLLHNRPSWHTLPADVVTSPRLAYQFTLIP